MGAVERGEIPTPFQPEFLRFSPEEFPGAIIGGITLEGEVSGCAPPRRLTRLVVGAVPHPITVGDNLPGEGTPLGIEGCLALHTPHPFRDIHRVPECTHPRQERFDLLHETGITSPETLAIPCRHVRNTLPSTQQVRSTIGTGVR